MSIFSNDIAANMKGIIVEECDQGKELTWDALSDDQIDALDAQEKLSALTGMGDFLAHLKVSGEYTGAHSAEKKYSIHHMHPNDVGFDDRKCMVDMVESDLKQLYNDAWGWDRAGKFDELFGAGSHLFVARPIQAKCEDTPIPCIAGFVMIRFCWDDDDEPEFPVVYVYELNVNSLERGSGLGRHLMQLVKRIQVKWGLWKVMLTCFKDNAAALAFYRKIGFDIDVYSPSRVQGWEPVKYEIMSNAPDKIM